MVQTNVFGKYIHTIRTMPYLNLKDQDSFLYLPASNHVKLMQVYLAFHWLNCKNTTCKALERMNHGQNTCDPLPISGIQERSNLYYLSSLVYFCGRHRQSLDVCYCCTKVPLDFHKQMIRNLFSRSNSIDPISLLLLLLCWFKPISYPGTMANVTLHKVQIKGNGNHHYGAHMTHGHKQHWAVCQQ